MSISSMKKPSGSLLFPHVWVLLRFSQVLKYSYHFLLIRCCVPDLMPGALWLPLCWKQWVGEMTGCLKECWGTSDSSHLCARRTKTNFNLYPAKCHVPRTHASTHTWSNKWYDLSAQRFKQLAYHKRDMRCFQALRDWRRAQVCVFAQW